MFASVAICGVAAAEPAPAPYVLPFQLRPAVAANAVRSDTAAAVYDQPAGGGSTVVTSLTASYKVRPRLVPFVRFAMIFDDPTVGANVTGTSNALGGLQWVPAMPGPLRVAIIGALTLPVGSGGGNSPDMSAAAANRAAGLARSAMDGAMFSANDATLVAGASVAYVARGLTLQAEATVFELIRARGADVQPDAAKTNLTSGVFAGYFLAPQVSLGAELRYQRYLSTPSFVTEHTRDTLTAAAGLRTHWQLDGGRWLRPAVAYARGLDGPLTDRHYHILQVDVVLTY